MSYADLRNEYGKIAFNYYKLGMTQDEIAREMSTSRPRINRILKKCLDMGIVKINIDAVADLNVQQEVQLETLLGLKEAIIASNMSNTDSRSVDIAASNYLERVINDNDTIGFSRGRALSSFANTLGPIQRNNLTVTQLVGGLNAGAVSINSDDIVRKASEALRAKPCYMYAPIILESPELRESLIKETFYENIYQTMKACTIAIVGIGDMSNHSAFDQRRYITGAELNALRTKEVVGEVCTHHFDINGNIIDTSLEERVLAISLKDYKSIPIRVGIAYGPQKLSAILGAIRSGLINVLVTDVETANGLTDLAANPYMNSK